MGTAVSMRARSELSAPFLDDRESALGITLTDRLQRLILPSTSSTMWQDVLPCEYSKVLPLVSAGAALRILACVIGIARHERVRPDVASCCACACHAYTFLAWRTFGPSSRETQNLLRWGSQAHQRLKISENAEMGQMFDHNRYLSQEKGQIRS